jgi:hypothetical protein
VHFFFERLAAALPAPSGGRRVSKADKGDGTMLFLREFVVRKHERGLLFKNGDFERFLAPSTYRFFDPRKRVEVERYDVSRPAFEHRLVDFLVRWYPEEVESIFVKVETDPGQVAVIYENGRPSSVLGPDRRALYWKGVVRVTAQMIDISTDFALAPRLKKAIVGDFGAGSPSAFEQAVIVREIPEAHLGLLYVDGRLADELGPGVHAFWKFNRRLAATVIDLRLKTLEIGGLAVRTRDHVGLRVDLSASYRFADARKAFTAAEDPLDGLSREIRLGLRVAVGARTLDQLLEDKRAAERAVLEHVRRKAAETGIDVRDVDVQDIVLAAAVKEIVGQVFEANPIALRLKELETLAKISEKVGNLSALGGLEDALQALARIKL